MNEEWRNENVQDVKVESGESHIGLWIWFILVILSFASGSEFFATALIVGPVILLWFEFLFKLKHGKIG